MRQISRHHSLGEKLKKCREGLRRWEIPTVGILSRRIKRVKGELEEAQTKPWNEEWSTWRRTKEKELDELLRQEEMWWAQRAKADWLKWGDRNTRFFH